METGNQKILTQGMDGDVWMTIRMTFSETRDAATKQKLHVSIFAMASKGKETKTKAF